MTKWLDDVDAMVQPLRQQVQAEQLVPKFGDKAQAIVTSAVAQMEGIVPELERIVDGQLEVLFLRQLALLRRQLAGKLEISSRPLEAITEADANFVAQAEELVRPGSSWSYERERYMLRAILEGTFRRDVALVEEKVKSARVQQTTVEVINNLQSQMEALQQKVQNLRAGSPWILSASYRVPKTPFQLIGRYQQGHGSLELSLSPDKDPANAEAGFVKGLGGPANIGVSVNMAA